MEVTGITRKSFLKLAALLEDHLDPATFRGQVHFCRHGSGTGQGCQFFVVADKDHARQQERDPTIECPEHGSSLVDWADLHEFDGRLYRWHHNWRSWRH